MEFETAFRCADRAIQAVRAGDGLKDVERAVLEGSWLGKTYADIAKDNKYSAGYLSRDVGPTLWRDLSVALNARVGKSSFRTAIARWAYQQDVSLPEVGQKSGNAPEVSTQHRLPLPQLSEFWGQCRVDVAGFCGRDADLATLKQWILEDHCRLIGISGVPGGGKTWLVAQLIRQMPRQGGPQRSIYLSLKDYPPEALTPQALLLELIVGLGFPLPPERSVTSLGHCLVTGLAQATYLVVLDHMEVWLQPQAFAGTYQPQLRDHGQWLALLAQQGHRSCILCVGRELPTTVTHTVRERCRNHWLPELPANLLDQLAYGACRPQGSAYDWRRWHQHYGGIPALTQRLVSQVYGLGESLQTWQLQRVMALSALTHYLEDWLAPLSPPEWSVLMAIALRNTPLPFGQIGPLIEGDSPADVAFSLRQRGLCQVPSEGTSDLVLAGGPPLRNHLCRTWVTQLSQDPTLKTPDPEAAWLRQLHYHPLLDPQAMAPGQRQQVLEPLAIALAPRLAPGERLGWVQQGLAISRQLEQRYPGGYSAGNLLNLAQYWQLPLQQLCLERLTLRGADLDSDRCQGISLAGSDLAGTHRAQPLGRSPIGAMAPGGETVVIGDQEGCLLVWQAQTGCLQTGRRLAPPSALRALTLSGDGRLLVEGRQDGRVHLWPLADGYGPEPLTGPQGATIQALALSPQGDWLAGGDAAGNLYLWHCASGDCYQHIDAHGAAVVAIAISPCGRFVLTGDRDGNATEWCATTGTPRQRYQGRSGAWLGTVGYRQGPDADPIPMAFGQDAGQAMLWPLTASTGIAQQVLPRPQDGSLEMPIAAALSPDGRYGAIGDISGTVHVWDLVQRQWLRSIPLTTPVTDLNFSPEGEYLMVCQDQRAQIWQLPNLGPWRTWDGHYPLATALGITSPSPPSGPLPQPTVPPRPHILSGHPDHTLRCWQQGAVGPWRTTNRLTLPAAKPLRTLITGPQNQVWVAGDEHSLHLWDCHQQVWLPTVIQPSAPITSGGLDATETWLALGDEQGGLSLWHLPTQTCRWQSTRHDRALRTLAFSPDGQAIACGSYDHTLSGWDLQGQRQWHLSGHHHRLSDLCFADAHTLFSVDRGGTVCQWDLTTHTQQRCWEIPHLIHALVRDPQGSPLAVIETAQQLEILDLLQSQVRLTLPCAQPLWRTFASPEGRYLLSASQGGQLTLWDLTTGQFEGDLRVDRPYEALGIRGCTGLTPGEEDLFRILGAVDY